jgi:hypothetical protein
VTLSPNSDFSPMQQVGGSSVSGGQGTNLADILERVLDTGIVIAGDIRVNLLDIELLTIKLRLVVASLETAKEAGSTGGKTIRGSAVRAPNSNSRTSSSASGSRNSSRETASDAR